MPDTRYALKNYDQTTTGGVLIATTQGMTHHGTPVGVEGDFATCPACKVGGPVFNDCHPNFSVMGKQILVTGARVHCKCERKPWVIHSQSDFTIEVDRGGYQGSTLDSGQHAPAMHGSDSNVEHAGRYDLVFHVKHERTGKNLCQVRYKITLEDGRNFIGVTDEAGRTQKVSANAALTARIEIPYYDNSTTDPSSEPEPCGC
jgi:uncharacterized Zn-binding protein involved in type VI secretion